MGNPDNSFTSPKPVEPTPSVGEKTVDANGFFEGGDTAKVGMSADEAKSLIDPSSPVDNAPLPAIEAVVPGTTQTAIIHTLEAAGLVALSFILTALVGSVGHFDVSHWQPIYQGLWTYALPTIVLGIQSAIKMVEAKKETVLAQKTLNAAKNMMKSFNAKNATV